MDRPAPVPRLPVVKPAFLLCDNNTNNNGYLERLTCTGPKNIEIL